MLTDIRLLSHQLAKPRFRSPKELVAWMGAVQAQEYTMAKWAVGTRLKSSSLRVKSTRGRISLQRSGLA